MTSKSVRTNFVHMRLERLYVLPRTIEVIAREERPVNLLYA